MKVSLNFNNNYSNEQYFTANASAVTKKSLEQAVTKGLKVSQICEELNISRSQYYDLLAKFSVQTPRKRAIRTNSSITKAQILGLIESGKKYDEIIKSLGISSTAYNEMLEKFNIVTSFKASKSNISRITAEILQSYVDSKKKVKDICKELGIPERTYTRLLDKFGILTERKKAKAHVASISRELLAPLVEQGMPKTEICSRLKLTESSFYKLLKIFNIPYNYLHHSNEKNISKAQIEKLFKEGLTTSEIADRLGVAVTTLHEKAKINHVKTEYRDSIDVIASIPVDEFQACLDSGMSIREVCKKFGINSSIYTTMIRKHNLRTAQRRSSSIISAITKEQILALKKQNKSCEEICKELNISESSYKRILKKGSEG